MRAIAVSEYGGSPSYALAVSPDLLERLAGAVVDGRIVPPPITDIHLNHVPAAWARAGHADGKTVITM